MRAVYGEVTVIFYRERLRQPFPMRGARMKLSGGDRKAVKF